MFCFKCSRENPDENKFCNGCGSSFAFEPIPSISPVIAVPAPPPPPPPPSRDSIKPEFFERADPDDAVALTDEPVIGAVSSSVLQEPVENLFHSNIGKLEVNTTVSDAIETLRPGPNYESFDDRPSFVSEAAGFDDSEYSEDLLKVFEEAESILDDLLPTGSAAQELTVEKEKSDYPSINFRPEEVGVRQEDGYSEEDSRPAAAATLREASETKLKTSEGIKESERELRPEEPRDDDSGKLPPSRLELPIDRIIARSPPGVIKNTSSRSLLPFIIAGVVLFAALAGIGIYQLSTEADVSTGVEPIQSTTTSPSNPNQAPPGMAFVPGGTFKMGSDTGDQYSRPAHTVTVGPFYMDITEVTNEKYLEFVQAKGHRPPPGWKNGTFPEGMGKFPVTGVDWDDAKAYAKWNGKRLPTEEEWEFAARGIDGRKYPWGPDWKPGFANAGPTNAIREVGQGDGKSPYGMFDMVGNAWEWTSSDFIAYPGGRLTEQDTGMKVIRGGCYQNDKDWATTSSRSPWLARGASSYKETSFRCAMDIPVTSK